MGKIATEQEAYNIGGKGSPINNKCCTAAKAEELGCLVRDKDLLDIKDNQLIQKEDLEKNKIYYHGVMIEAVDDGFGPMIGDYVWPYTGTGTMPSQEPGPDEYYTCWPLVKQEKNPSGGWNCYFGLKSEVSLQVNVRYPTTQFQTLTSTMDWYACLTLAYYWTKQKKHGIDNFWI